MLVDERTHNITDRFEADFLKKVMRNNRTNYMELKLKFQKT